MRFPRFDFFSKQEQDGPSIIYASGSPTLSGNPRFYKHLWQVFSRESPHEGDAFFERAPVLCTAAMLLETQRLVDAGLTCVLYGFKRPREGPGAPWDRQHPRWRDAVFAPAWEDDTDPITAGGHK